MNNYSCNKCIKNDHQKYNACGYISKKETRKPKHEKLVLYPFDLYPANYGLNTCLYWYLREYWYLRDIYNMIKSTDILNSSFLIRTISKTTDLHYGLKLKRELEKAKERK